MVCSTWLIRARDVQQPTRAALEDAMARRDEAIAEVNSAALDKRSVIEIQGTRIWERMTARVQEERCMANISFISENVGGFTRALMRDGELGAYEANLKVSESV